MKILHYQWVNSLSATHDDIFLANGRIIFKMNRPKKGVRNI